MKCALISMLLSLILSGCWCRDAGSMHKEVREPDAVPEMSLGRVVQLPDMNDQLLVEVFVVNKGRCPVALDLNRFSVEIMSLDPEDSPWSLFGWFDSLGETCVTTFPADSSNRFVLATSYIGPCNTNSGTDWDEKRWRDRKDGNYYFSLHYAPPSQSTVDYLWVLRRFERKQQVLVQVDARELHFSKRLGDRSPTWEKWRNGRTNESPWEAWRKERDDDR